MLSQVLERIHQRIASSNVESSYIASLVAEGENKILKKIGEEATEVVLASKDGDRDTIVYELTDLWFHCLVLMAEKKITLKDVDDEFHRRYGQSGLDEKASRATS